MNMTGAIRSGIKVFITRLILSSGFILFGLITICHAKEITLQWDPSPPADNIEYYRIYYDDDTSGPPYNGTGLNLNGINVASGFPLDAGASVTVSGLRDDKIYYFAITAVNNNGLESDYSVEAAAETSLSDTSDPSDVTETPQTTPYSGSDEYRGLIPDMTLSGYIVDDNGAGIDNAEVTLLSPKQCYAGTVTAGDGFFSFEGIPDSGSRYQFSVSKNGYITMDFTSDDLLSLESQPSVILIQAGENAYIEGEISISGAVFSGEPAEVTLSYIDENGIGILAGKDISPDGLYRIDFEEVLTGVKYILTAARPGEYGQINADTWPQSGVTIDINTLLTGDDVNALAGGASRPVTLAGQSVSIVRVPFGGIDPAGGVASINIDIATTFDNNTSNITSGSGNLLYHIDMDQDITVILTLPFDLTEVFPGDFENGEAIIYHADTVNELISETNLQAVNMYDIISVDYKGDGSTGLVEFYADSFSVFGVGLPISTSTDNLSVDSMSTQTPSGGGGGGGCFIATVADAVGEKVRYQRIQVLFGIIVLIGVVRWRLKGERAWHRSRKSGIEGQ